MKALLFLFICTSFFSQSLFALSTQTLNKKIVSSYVEATNKLSLVDKKHPGILAQADKFKMSERDQLIKFLKSSKAYSDISDVISASGFNSIDNYVDTSFQILSSIYAVQSKEMPDFVGLIKKDIKSLKAKGATPATLKNLKDKLDEAIAYRKEIEASIKQATSDDKKFVKDNIKWVMTQLSKQ